MTASGPDGSASWVRALVRTTPARISWQRVGLAAVGITTPVAIGLTLEPHVSGAAVAGTLAAMGAMVGSITDVGAAGAQRIQRVALASVLASIGFALGTAVYGHAVLTLVAVVGAALASGLAGTISATASKAALYFLVYVVTAANADFGLTPSWLAVVAFAVGAGWRLALTVVAAAVRGVSLSPERRAVAHVYAALADQLEASGSASAPRAADGLTAALNDAYDVLVSAETGAAVRDARWQGLVTALNAAAPVVDAAIAMVAAGRKADPRTVGFLRGIADWVSTPGAAPPQLPAPHAGLRLPNAEQTALRDSVRRAARTLDQVDLDHRRRVSAEQDIPEKSSVAELLRGAEWALVTGSEHWVAVLRLVLCMAVAQGLSLALHLDRPYLVMLTVAQVMKPELGSVFARAVQRGTGTFIGVGVGSLAILLIPAGAWQVVAVLVFAAVMPIVMPRNYGLYAVISTPLAVMLVEMHAGVHAGLVESRLLDTVLGCAIVLVLGYAVWPSSWRAPRRLGGSVAGLCRSLAEYAQVALGPAAAERSAEAGAVPSRTDARRAAYRSISNIRAEAARALAEPPPVSSAAAAWMPAIGALERVTDAVTAAATTAEASGVRIDPKDVAEVEAALTDLAESIDSARLPGSDPVPATGTLAQVGEELGSARAAASAHLTATRRVPSRGIRTHRSVRRA